MLFPMEPKRAMILVDGQPFSFVVFLSTDDSFTLVSTLEQETANCRKAVAEYILRQLDVDDTQKPSIERVLAQSNAFFETVFELLLQDNDDFKIHYERRKDDPDICHRFVAAINDGFEKIANPILDTIVDVAGRASTLSLSLPAISSDAFKMLENRQFQIFEKMQQMYTVSINALSAFSQISDAWFENIRHSFEAAQLVSGQIAELIKAVQIPTLTEDRKEEICASYKKWGEYGWTMPLSAPIRLFSAPPTSKNDANKKALAYCKSKDVQELFSLLRNVKGIKKSDLEEAIFDFEQGKYKSCVLVLFGLVDAKLIRLQREEDRNKRNRKRPVGKTAATNLFRHIQEETNIDKQVHQLFEFQNIYACLLSVFADGDDFTNQPSIVNRNFVDHGMIHRKVSRRDCVQMFLLYYHLLKFLDRFYRNR